MNRNEKSDFVKNFGTSLSQYPCMVLVRQNALNASDVISLRSQAREKNIVFEVVKNSLVKIAFEKEGVPLKDHMKGPVGVLFSHEPVEIAKLVKEFSKGRKKDTFCALAGQLDDQILTAEKIDEMASLPNLDQLRAQIIGLIGAVGSKLARTIQGNAQKYVFLLSNYIQKSK